MSRIAKKTIPVPEKTGITVSGNTVRVKGPLGETSRTFRPDVISIEVGAEGVTLKPVKKTLEAESLWGTYASHVKNMLSGVNAPYRKSLVIEGIGFKGEVQGNTIVFGLGFSHPVKIAIPAGLKVTSEKNIITISGVDNELVGQFAAVLRDLKKPEPYKGKGIRYSDETILRKEGKKSAV